jgi:hypothetical protein
MKKALIFVAAFALPAVAFAQTLDPILTFVQSVGHIVATLVPILIALAMVVFFWGLVRYLWGKGGKSDIAGAKSLMIWGLITLFVMVSVWGIINLAGSALRIGQGGSVPLPQVPAPN